MRCKRSSRISRHFGSPEFWLFSRKVEFFNTHSPYHQLRPALRGFGRIDGAGLCNRLTKISTGGLHPLDKGKSLECRLPTMSRVLTIGLAVVVILSCVTVMITPDLADDINGVLHQHHSVRGHKLLAVAALPLRPLVVATFHSFNSVISPLHSSTPRLLALVCVRLC